MRENPSTYFVQNRKDKKELNRLKIQDQMVTAMMGGVLPEQADTTVFRSVLDVGCGTGGWLIEAALTCPEMSLVGIDISQQMIKYARTQAEEHLVHDRVEFRVMDALGMLDFPAASFDLVNLRFGVSFVRIWDWATMLSELQRITRPSGVIRVTDSDVVSQNNSPALTLLCNDLQRALFRAGHLFEQESVGVIDHLPQLLKQYGCKAVQTKVYVVECRAGTAEGEAFYEDMGFAFQMLHPFIEKWVGAAQDYKAIYRQALNEMRKPDFCVKWNVLTAWGSKR